MAPFRATIHGSRGAVSRSGHKEIFGHVCGWNKGIKVWGSRNDNGDIKFEVYKTGGSNGGELTLIATI